jgi:hypothetical protein
MRSSVRKSGPNTEHWCAPMHMLPVSGLNLDPTVVLAVHLHSCVLGPVAETIIAVNDGNKLRLPGRITAAQGSLCNSWSSCAGAGARARRHASREPGAAATRPRTLTRTTHGGSNRRTPTGRTDQAAAVPTHAPASGAAATQAATTTHMMTTPKLVTQMAIHTLTGTGTDELSSARVLTDFPAFVFNI